MVPYELVMIPKRRWTSGHVVLPLFYHLKLGGKPLVRFDQEAFGRHELGSKEQNDKKEKGPLRNKVDGPGRWRH